MYNTTKAGQNLSGTQQQASSRTGVQQGSPSGPVEKTKSPQNRQIVTTDEGRGMGSSDCYGADLLPCTVFAHLAQIWEQGVTDVITSFKSLPPSPSRTPTFLS